jgi:16S rRNA (uracil1498-N3)-methyltransferase
MQRLYSPSKNITGDKIVVDDKTQVHHLKDVLRIKAGSEVMVFDEQGNEYSVNVEEVLVNKLILKIREKHKTIPVDRPKVAIACAIPKKGKFDDIVDKLTQLGVDKIIPLETERVIVILNKNKQASRLERWKKIALSAAQQSQRNSLPVIGPVKSIEEVLSEAGSYDFKIIAYLTGERKTLNEVFNKGNFKNILVLIGPEGDFTPEEVSLALEAGFIPVTLGDSVLRVETAAIAVASFIRLI